jgi:hypothetical protein
MQCPDTDYECDNPGCRHGGCQGRRPVLPLFRTQTATLQAPRPSLEPALIRGAQPHLPRSTAPAPMHSRG